MALNSLDVWQVVDHKVAMQFREILTHIPISWVVSPGQSIHTVLNLKFGHPVVILWATLNHNPRHFSGLTKVYLNPA